MKSSELLTAYHSALMREITAQFVTKPVEVEQIAVQAAPEPKSTPHPRTMLKRLSDIPAVAPFAAAPERQKIRVTIVDHNVSRTPTEFEREYADHPDVKFKFLFAAIGSKDIPAFKQGGYAIIAETAQSSWKVEAVKVCSRQRVFYVNGSRESVRESMEKIIASLKTPARNGSHK